MRVAIVHEWLVNYAGSERVVKEILSVVPDADIFAVVDFMSPKMREKFGNKKARTTFIQSLPFAKTHFRKWLPLMPIAIERLDLSPYDLVISSNHAVAKGVKTTTSQLHISYVHTPMRYAWDMQHEYLREAKLDRGVKGWAAKWMLNRLRCWDAKTAENVDFIVANSEFVSARIQRCWERESKVIYPPVDTKSFVPRGDKESIYLAASRLVPYKRVDAIVEAFNRMPNRKLVVIGDGPGYSALKRTAGPNVQLLGFQPDEVLVDYMQRARAFLFAAEEDFGIIAVEAQACGTPVIAYGKGGARESVRSLDDREPTGVFFDEQEPDSIVAAVQLFERESDRFTPEYCRRNADRFSEERFRAEFSAFVTEAVRQWKAGKLVRAA